MQKPGGGMPAGLCGFEGLRGFAAASGGRHKPAIPCQTRLRLGRNWCRQYGDWLLSRSVLEAALTSPT